MKFVGILLLSFFFFAPRTSGKHIGDLETETGFYQTLRVTDESPIFEKKSQYQQIEVHESAYYGRILVLDNVVQLTERDADSYNEMMAHIPMMQHKNPKRVLVIGGGDGYVLNEVLKHPSVVHVDHVDLDGEVIETCKIFFPWSKAWDDPRATLHVADGAAFVRNAEDGSYDVIIQDSSDPWQTDDEGNQVPLPSGVLYSEEHISHISRILKPDGIFNFQAETFNLPSDVVGIAEWRQKTLAAGFVQARYGSLYIATYPTGQIGFLMCEKDPSLRSTTKEIEDRFKVLRTKGTTTTYYQPKLQESSFDLPLWVEHQVYGQSAEIKDEL